MAEEQISEKIPTQDNLIKEGNFKRESLQVKESTKTVAGN